MGDEISISLQETNAIRLQLGLKPIEPEHKPENGQQHIEHKQPNKTKDEEFKFMDNARASVLRKRLSSLRDSTTKSLHQREDNNDEDWLAKIGTHKRHKPVKIIHEEEDEEEIPSLKISHKINEIDLKKGAIFTLKEQSINDEDGNTAILENAEFVQAQRDRQNLRLKEFSRKSKFKSLQVSSFDLEKEEQSGDNNDESLLTVGTENKADADKPSAQGKIKLEFNEPDDKDTEQSTDFQPVKIKKRSKRDVKSRIKLPSKVQAVELVDEDEGIGEDQEEQIAFSSRPLLKSKVQTPQEIAQQIHREKMEKQDRILNISRTNESTDLIIDENVQFLESLKVNLVENEFQQQQAEQKQDKSDQEQTTLSNAPTIAESQPPDFSTGLASTLHFLQKKDLLPSSNDITEDNNSEINLIYRDEKGIPLTTKEAYKKLSQKFHGTKSNKKKKEKFESKLRARHNGNVNANEKELQP